MTQEWAKKIEIQQRGHREGRLHFPLYNDLHLPLVVPGLREANFDDSVGFSLPPYAPKGTRDTALAFHFARFGDQEAADALVDPNDTEAKGRIAAAAYERRYPVEWTRLVGLLLHAAQVRLATGDVDGGTELIVLHRQLRDVLDAKARVGPLGVALLTRGYDVLAHAAAAWRADKKTELADQADAALAEWTDRSEPALAVTFGMDRSQVARILRSSGIGRAVAADSPLRALDLLELPFPDENIGAVVAHFDAAQKLSHVRLTYRAGLAEWYPEPSHLAHLIAESTANREDVPASVGLRPCAYRLGGMHCQVRIVTHGAGVGALVDLFAQQDELPAGKLSRDLGGVHLDRSFEQNRLHLTPEQRGEQLVVQQPGALSAIHNPLSVLKLGEAIVEREGTVTPSVRLQYHVDEATLPPLHQIVLPFWSSAGLSRIFGESDTHGGHLALMWDDGHTRYQLQLPYENGHPVELVIADTQAGTHLRERETAAAAFDRAEREARLKAGKPLLRIPRQLDDLELGMSRSQVTQALPSGRAVTKQDFPDGLTATFAGEPAETEAYVVRQIFARFDKNDHAVELRTRYAEGPKAHGAGWMADIERTLRKRAGAPWDAPAPWSAVWAEISSSKGSAIFHGWRDDRSLLTYQRDSSTVEVTLRDCPPEFENGVPLPPLASLPAGPDAYQLGTSREQIVRLAGAANPGAMADGALVLRPNNSDLYDAVLIWFEHDHAARIVARHTPASGARLQPNQWGQALAEAAARAVRTLGWPRRQEVTGRDLLQSVAWHDDQTRIRMFWQENEDGSVHLFTEWKVLLAPR
jgi:hypothetical protein